MEQHAGCRLPRCEPQVGDELGDQVVVLRRGPPFAFEHPRDGHNGLLSHTPRWSVLELHSDLEYCQGMRRTATTANAILGLLALQREWSTWELTKQLRRNMRFFWPRAESQIYVEAKGLV